MNEILQNIMVFINEHTLLLIGICVFLILVLVGYLIDNSVKSKRIRNDIKNADQVPENIKDEIIRSVENQKIIKENSNVDDNKQLQNQTESVDLSKNEPTVESQQINDQPILENTQINDSPLDLDKTMNENEFPTFDLNSSSNTLNFESEPLVINEPTIDPDANIMMSDAKNEYTNDKKLSEILFNVENINQQVNDDSNIFNNNSSNNIVINNEVKKDDVQIQSNNSSEELDRIMRKLSTMNNNVEDDNYTNIF